MESISVAPGVSTGHLIDLIAYYALAWKPAAANFKEQLVVIRDYIRESLYMWILWSRPKNAMGSRLLRELENSANFHSFDSCVRF